MAFEPAGSCCTFQAAMDGLHLPGDRQKTGAVCRCSCGKAWEVATEMRVRPRNRASICVGDRSGTVFKISHRNARRISSRNSRTLRIPSRFSASSSGLRAGARTTCSPRGPTTSRFRLECHRISPPTRVESVRVGSRSRAGRSGGARVLAWESDDGRANAYNLAASIAGARKGVVRISTARQRRTPSSFSGPGTAGLAVH
jgi:hypothetical protein